MGAVVGIGVAIAGAIGSAVAAAASAVAAAAAAIGSAIASIGAAIAGAVSAAVSAVTAAVGAIGSAISGAVSSISSFVFGEQAMIGLRIARWGIIISSKISAFAEAIHLKLIMAVHNIAYILSSDYRRMIKGVTRKLGEMGDAIGASESGTRMAFKNAETLVKDVGGIMGRSYDLTDVTWLKTLSGYLKRREGKIRDMGDGLMDLLPDIDEYIIKPAIDSLAEEQRTFFSLFKGLGSTMEKVTSDIEGLFGDFDTLRQDLNKTVEDLPDFISEEMQPSIDAINEGFDYFKDEVYSPFKETTNDLINVIQGKQMQAKKDIDSIVDRLLYPGDILKGVEDLSTETRIDQENKVGDIASKSMKREADDLESQAAPSFDHLQKLKELIKAELAPPKWKITEAGEITVPIGGQSRKAATWFVGDF